MRTAAALFLFAVPAAAQDWPPKVTAIVEEARSICSGDFATAAEAVMRRDMNGDGTPDWVIDSHFFRCSDGYDTYCHVRGCRVDTLINGTRGTLSLRSWDTMTENGTTYLTTHNNKGRPIRFFWTGTEWRLE